MSTAALGRSARKPPDCWLGRSWPPDAGRRGRAGLWFAGSCAAQAARSTPSCDILPLAAVSITAASIPLAAPGLRWIALAWLLLAAEELSCWRHRAVGSARRNFRELADSASAAPTGRVASQDKAGRATPGDRRASCEFTPWERTSRRNVGPYSTFLPATPTACSGWFACRNLTGADRLEGSLSTRFAAGQTTAIIHVAFCPSFRARAHARLPPARRTAGQDQAWPAFAARARFEIKLVRAAALRSRKSRSKSSPTHARNQRDALQLLFLVVPQSFQPSTSSLRANSWT